MTNFLALAGQLLESPLWQESGPFSGTNSFLNNFFYGGGIGAWLLFFILALAAVVWLFYDSQTRRLNAPLWRIGVLLAALLLFPVILFRFTVTPLQVSEYWDLRGQIDRLERYQEPADWQDTVDALQEQINNLPVLTGFQEAIAYLGILGGLGAAAIAAAYYVTFKGLLGCPNGHIYDQILSECPECSRNTRPGPDMVFPGSFNPEPATNLGEGAPKQPARRKAQAWLAAADGRSYQLFLGETSLGRSAQNDIQIDGDTTLGRAHAKIVENNGHFRLHDLGSVNGTSLNGRRLRQPSLLEADDEILLGDNTRLRFVTTQK